MTFIRTMFTYYICLTLFLSFAGSPVRAGEGAGSRDQIFEPHLDEKAVTYYHQLIRDYFESSGITYSSSITKTDPFFREEKCVEKYRQYSIKSIQYIKSEKNRHIFRVSCSGFDQCNRIVATDIYTVSVSKPGNRITYTKMENR